MLIAAVDQADAWCVPVGMVHHMAWASADAALWTGCMGPRWTGHVPNRYVLISTVHARSNGTGS